MRCPLCLPVFAPHANTLCVLCRMELLQQRKKDGHGQYLEIMDEKEVIRLSAWVWCSLHTKHLVDSQHTGRSRAV